MPRIIKPAVGAFTTADISVDSSGRIYKASSGTGGSAPNLLTTMLQGPATATFTANPATTKIQLYMRGAGGGGGGVDGSSNASGFGGDGGFGVWSIPVSQPYAVPYAIGVGVARSGNTVPGQAGGASTWNTNLIANGGNGGGRYSGGNYTPGSPGDCDAPEVTVDYSQPTNDTNIPYYMSINCGATAPSLKVPVPGGVDMKYSGTGAAGNGTPSAAGTPGAAIVFEDIG
tara:strand:- start:789 stop:1475 length:687 start_codon:yes stop_codon:yes gene_type:complete